MSINHNPRRTFIKSGLAITAAALLPLKQWADNAPAEPDLERIELKRLLKTYGPEIGPNSAEVRRKNHGHI